MTLEMWNGDDLFDVYNIGRLLHKKKSNKLCLNLCKVWRVRMNYNISIRLRVQPCKIVFVVVEGLSDASENIWLISFSGE